MNSRLLLAGALAASLAANAFLAGWLIGRPAAPAAPVVAGQPMLGGALRQQLLPLLRKLPDEQRQQLRNTLREHAPQLRQLAEANRAGRQQVLDQLSQDKLDTDALQAAFTRQRQNSAALQQASQELIQALAGQLSAEQRRQLLQQRPELLRRGG